MKGDEKKAEEKEYLWTADRDSGLIELLLNSKEIVSHLEGHLAHVLRKKKKGQGIDLWRH